MSNTQEFDKDTKAKFKNLITEITVAMMATKLGETPLHIVPMMTKKVDDLGNIWFLSGGHSDHNGHIVNNPKTQLVYSDPKQMEFISVYGNAFISTDQSILEDLYSKDDDRWFDGVTDPNLTAIKFTPKEAEFWDSTQNKYINLFKVRATSSAES
ncbi:pyridoxamine 5'-phosphate oxidase family protein [Croceibacter atlanticus]|uniref:pyridoxamine 5'-phosphate oxidase family protein n=1 Tax=Croceibacter atlanticus TaxID=313588 RepID=UPI0032B27C8B|tara:strand:+ start:880 stop:1344 length:465 start_codon:yes stop_codon:yes gene_type:complete